MAAALSTKQRNILRDHARATANPADQLRGYTCPHCGQLGAHFEDRCPAKPFIGVPEVQRIAMQEAAVLDATGPAYYCTPPGYISGAELRCMLRARADVPPCLRCSACAHLCVDAVWCATCDAIACSGCLAPPDEAWCCPRCECTAEDNFHVVTAVRQLAEGWLAAMAVAVDTTAGIL